jgi:hypothetical protein
MSCLAGALLFLGPVACGSSTATSPGIPATAPGASAIATAPPADDATGGATANEDDADDSGDSATTAPGVGKKVSANSASEAEIAKALTAAGVSNPGRRAAEVVEYRPYPTDDPDLTTLRKNLATNDLDPETIDRVIAVLRP